MKNKQVLKLKYLTCIKHLNSTIKAPNYRVFLASKLEKSVYLKKVHWSVTVFLPAGDRFLQWNLT